MQGEAVGGPASDRRLRILPTLRIGLCSARYNCYMSTPLSIRFDSAVLDRLRRRAQTVPGATPSGLAQLLVDEGLRMAEHPGVVFKDGPAGRRAALALGPDIWEVVTVAKEIDPRGARAVTAIAERLDLPAARIETALRYYAAYPDEIDAEIEDREAESRAAEEEWHIRQRLLS